MPMRYSEIFHSEARTMTEQEAREWLGLPENGELTELGKKVMAAVMDIPPPGDGRSNIEVFKDFLIAMNEAGIKPPRKPLIQNGYKE